ncbi:MAG: lasso peptide biosynthesis B2 protein [Sporolactobacillus sp.]
MIHFFRMIAQFERKSHVMKKLYFEALTMLLWSRLITLIPFSKIATRLGTHNRESTFFDAPENRELLEQINQAVRVVSRHVFWRSLCLQQAIAALYMLRRRHISCTLYLAVAKGQNQKMVAHALLRSGSYYVTGAGTNLALTIVGTFASDAV